MPLNLVFIQPGNYTIDDNGIPGDNTSVIRDGNGTVIFTFVHPADSLGFTVTTPGVNVTVNLTDTLGTANLTIGNLTSAAASPDSIAIGNVRTTGIVTLVANGAITEFGSDAGADILASQVILSAGTGVGTAANAIETQTSAIEAETNTGGINLSNFGSVQVGAISDQVDGLDVVTSGNLNFTATGTILLADETGAETVHGGTSSGNVTLTASGFDSDIISTVDQDAISALGGNILLTAGRDIAFGIIGADYDNDVRARGSVTINAGRDVLVDGFSDIASDDFAANTGGNLVVNAARNIHVRNVAGTDGSLTASGSASADLILTTGIGGAVILDAPSTGALSSFNGDVTVNADRILIASTSGITASAVGQVTLRPVTAGREIFLGSAGDASIALELSDAELTRIFSSNLTIGADNAGSISVLSDITAAPANVTLRSGENVSIGASFTNTTSLTLRAGDNIVHTAGTISTGRMSALVDTVGNDAGVGGFGRFFAVVAAPITLDGAGESDTLYGIEGVEQTVHGNGGNDTIMSSGEGHYFGDAGNDTMLAGLSSGIVPEVLDGGTGVDTLDTRSFSGDYIINLATGVTNFGYESFVNFENIITGNGNDLITGSSGNNIISTNGGNDAINGAAGIDTATYSGTRANYDIMRLSNGALRIFDLRGGSPDGTDAVRNVENFQFSDGTKKLSQVIDITDFNLFLTHGTTHEVRNWIFTNGAISSNQAFSAPPATWKILASGDFNGDGIGDAFWRNSATGEVRDWLLDGAGGIASNVVVGSAASNWRVLATGDYNGDGTSDVVWQNTNSGETRIWMMANGTISSINILASVLPQWQLQGTADFNGDGTYDILWHNTVTGDTRAWTIVNGAIAVNGSVGPLSPQWIVAATGDFNHDGVGDLVWRNTSTGDTRIWEMANGALSSNVALGPVASNWKIIGAGDYTQDGHDDLIWTNTTNGDTRVWDLIDSTLTNNIMLTALPSGWAAAVNPAIHSDFLPVV